MLYKCLLLLLLLKLYLAWVPMKTNLHSLPLCNSLNKENGRRRDPESEKPWLFELLYIIGEKTPRLVCPGLTLYQELMLLPAKAFGASSQDIFPVPGRIGASASPLRPLPCPLLLPALLSLIHKWVPSLPALSSTITYFSTPGPSTLRGRSCPFSQSEHQHGAQAWHVVDI